MIFLDARRFESIAKTNTTHTVGRNNREGSKFESIAKTNTTHTYSFPDANW